MKKARSSGARALPRDKSRAKVYAKSRRSPDVFFDSVSSLESLAELLGAMDSETSISAAVSIAWNEEPDCARRKKADELREDIERFYGVSFIGKGIGSAKVLSTNENALAVLSSLKEGIERLVAEKKKLQELREHPRVPELRIGTIPSIAGYLMPSVVETLKSELKSTFDLRISQGDPVSQFRELQARRLDIVIQAGKDQRAKQMGLVEVPLPYRRRPQGITFLHSYDGKPGPFNKLSAFIKSPKSFSTEKFIAILKESPLALMETNKRHEENDYERAIEMLFSRESSKHLYESQGMRFRLPTYRHERQFVVRGLAVGFGHPPYSVVSQTNIDGCKVMLGTDPGLSKSLIAYFDLAAFGKSLPYFSPFKEQGFSIYLRDDFDAAPIKGGLSDIALKGKHVVEAICHGYFNGDSRLQYSNDDDGHFLLHSFTYPDES